MFNRDNTPRETQHRIAHLLKRIAERLLDDDPNFGVEFMDGGGRLVSDGAAYFEHPFRLGVLMNQSADAEDLNQITTEIMQLQARENNRNATV